MCPDTRNRQPIAQSADTAQCYERCPRQATTRCLRRQQLNAGTNLLPSRACPGGLAASRRRRDLWSPWQRSPVSRSRPSAATPRHARARVLATLALSCRPETTRSQARSPPPPPVAAPGVARAASLAVAQAQPRPPRRPRPLRGGRGRRTLEVVLGAKSLSDAIAPLDELKRAAAQDRAWIRQCQGAAAFWIAPAFPTRIAPRRRSARHPARLAREAAQPSRSKRERTRPARPARPPASSRGPPPAHARARPTLDRSSQTAYVIRGATATGTQDGARHHRRRPCRHPARHGAHRPRLRRRDCRRHGCRDPGQPHRRLVPHG